MPIAEAVAMVEAGEINDAKTILGVFWLDRLARGRRALSLTRSVPANWPGRFGCLADGGAG